MRARSQVSNEETLEESGRKWAQMSEKRPLRQKLVLCGSIQPGVWRSSHPHLCTTSDKITKEGVFSAFELPSSILLSGLRSIKRLDQQSFVNDPFYSFWPQRTTSSWRNSALPGFCDLALFFLFSFLLPSPAFSFSFSHPHTVGISQDPVFTPLLVLFYTPGIILPDWFNFLLQL